MKKNLVNFPQYLIAIAILVVGILLSVVSVLVFAPLYRNYLSNEASYQCAQSYRFTLTKADGTSVSYPMTELYQKCLSEKKVK